MAEKTLRYKTIEDLYNAIESCLPSLMDEMYPQTSHLLGKLNFNAGMTKKIPQRAVQDYTAARTHAIRLRLQNPKLPPLPDEKSDPIIGLQSIQEWCIEAQTASGDKAEETQNKPDTENIAVDDKELTILIELNAGENKTFSQVEIEASTSIKRGTIKDKLPRLEEIGLIHRPLGKRKGYQITDKGRKIAKRHQ